MPRIYINQNFPNYQEQRPGPEPGIGMLPPQRGPKSRPRITAPMSVNNIPLPQQHLFYYRDDPSGAGPGGQDIHLPEQPRPMNPLKALLLALRLPRGSRLPVAPWAMINDSDAMWTRQVTGGKAE